MFSHVSRKFIAMHNITVYSVILITVKPSKKTKKFSLEYVNSGPILPHRLLKKVKSIRLTVTGKCQFSFLS